MRERTDAGRPDRAMPAGSGSGGDTDSAELERGYRKAEGVQAEGIFGQDLHRHADPGRAGDELFGVQLVESGEVAHVRQEAGGLDCLFKARPCGGILAQPAEGEYKAVGLIALGVKADGAGGRRRFDHFHYNLPLSFYDAFALWSRPSFFLTNTLTFSVFRSPSR